MKEPRLDELVSIEQVELARRCLRWQRRALAAEIQCDELQRKIDSLQRVIAREIERSLDDAAVN